MGKRVKNMGSIRRVVCLYAMAAFINVSLMGCDSSSPSSEKQQPVSALYPVLVTVNEEPIDQKDLELAVQRTVGEHALFQIDEQAKRKILESLVMFKSLALEKLGQLNAEEKHHIEKEVRAFRDELLAKRFLKENVTPVPVTDEMVKQWYDNHPEKYGSRLHRQYQMVIATKSLSGQQRTEVMSALMSMTNKNTWKDEVSRLSSSGLPVRFSEGVLNEGTMAPEFERVIKPLEEGQTSALFFLQGKPALVKVNKITKTQAKPLAEVSHQIRKQLAPVQLKKAIKKSANEIMSKMNIQYASEEK